MEPKLLEVEILKMIRQIDAKLDETNAKLDATDVKLDEHMANEERDLRTLHTKVESLSEAFPNHDIPGHRMYHSSVIERNNWVTQLCKDAVKELAKWGLLGFVAWLGYQAWAGFLHGPMK